MPRVHWLAARGRATPAGRLGEIALASFSLYSPQLPAQPRPCLLPLPLHGAGRNSHDLGALLNRKTAEALPLLRPADSLDEILETWIGPHPSQIFLLVHSD